MNGDSLVTYVARSELRSAVLRAVERDARSTAALRDDLDVSRSGVYKTLDELADSGLVRQSDGWELTARGRLVADELARQRTVDDLLDDEFWEAHDVSVLPRRFRQRLAGAGEWELYRNPARNPQYLERWAVELFREANWLRVGAQVYYPRFAQMVDELADRGVLDAQVIVDDRLVDEAIERYADGDAPSCIDERVADLPFSFTVTADLVALSLPTRDGVSDLDAVLVGSGDGAVELGRDIHDHYWDRAVPVEDYLATV
ncbi:helix-turn-helix transcriptional regulator [Halosimplex sp. TS25]|uniref:helix-turn-helix transcriptional regulator n=1 Tax=Halosimplex rarum TaxID=3396619 RepID=UPI0039EC6451